MITIEMKSGELKKFNLSNYDSERGLLKSWEKLKDDPDSFGKSLRLNTQEGKLHVAFAHMKGMEFDEALYAEAVLADHKIGDRPDKKEKTGDQGENMGDFHNRYEKFKKRKQQKDTESFVNKVNELRKRRGL
jgi:hypothetical protein